MMVTTTCGRAEIQGDATIYAGLVWVGLVSKPLRMPKDQALECLRQCVADGRATMPSAIAEARFAGVRTVSR